MNCPKCGAKMESGFLYAKDVITWAPTLLPLGLSIFNKDAINVSSPKYMETQNIPSQICKACHLILADYSDR